jgi:hypothetical protein
MIALRFASRDMIDVEKISITGNVFKMLLGSFVEEIDAMNDSVEDLSSPDESPSFQAIVSTPTKNPPLLPISEMHDSLLLPTGDIYDMQQTPPAQQKAKKSRPFPRFFSEQSR